MSIRIGSNIAALRPQRKLTESSDELGKVLERLSSGSRITRASDDAAGLAIANTLNAKSRVYTRAVKNTSDGISLIAIAESSLRELSGISTRILELAEQSANGVYSGRQREAMDREAQELSEEYFRISRSTTFNGMNLFDGSMQGVSIQAGIGVDGVLSSSMGGLLGTGDFENARTVSTATNPNFVVSGDFNNDGFTDLVSARTGSNTIAMFTGNGDGTFKTGPTFSTGPNPYQMTAGDIDGNGTLDLAVANQGGASVSIFLGRGDGSFDIETPVSAGNAPAAVALGDLNSDGVADMVVANAGVSSASILMGRGDGTFVAKPTLTTGTNPIAVSLGDLNNDGILDVATANYLSNNISVFLGNGDGTFAAGSLIATGAWPKSLVFGDYNGDGNLDIATGNENGNSVFVLNGNGDGTFTAGSVLTTGSAPRDITTADLNGDGILDIVTADRVSAAVSVFKGNGDGTFKARSSFATGNGPRAVNIGDVNGDGVPDIITANGTGAGLSVLLAATHDGVSPLLPFSLKTRSSALQALMPVKQKLEALSSQLGVLGAFQTRLQTAATALGASAENFETAESRIRDTDVAADTAQMVRLRILRDAGAAVLGQANQQPQIAIKLLGMM